METNKVFWLEEYEGEAKGGLFYRAFDMIEFIKKVETEKKCKVVGIAFDGSHNIEFITTEVKDG